jgi:hypothetical protein
LLFNQFAPPTGTNASDFTLLSNSTAGVGNPVLSLSSTPQLRPGAIYYLGVQNTGAAAVTAVVQVDFDITPLANGVPVNGAIDPGSLSRYFYYDVSSSTVAVSFQLLNLTGNADLVARLGPALPNLQNYDYGSFNPGTNAEQITIFTNSSPQVLTPGRWYLGVFDSDVSAVAYTILATEITNPPPIITLTNMVPYPNTNSGVGFASDYYRFTVGPTAVRAQFEIDNPSADVTLVARKGLPPPDPTSYDLISANPGTNGQLIVFFDFSTPVPLTPGDWYLSAANLSGQPVSYTIMASDWSAYGTNIVITNWVLTSNSFCLTWTSLAGAHYQVVGLTNVAYSGPSFWGLASPTIVATNNLTTYCIDLPSPWNYFFVVEGSVLTNGPVAALSVSTASTDSSSGGRFPRRLNRPVPAP